MHFIPPRSTIPVYTDGIPQSRTCFVCICAEAASVLVIWVHCGGDGALCRLCIAPVRILYKMMNFINIVWKVLLRY